ncbi:MAG: prenyltransferase/squalene oxidase repeat-containing protein [Planctomycetota bacterium]
MNNRALNLNRLISQRGYSGLSLFTLLVALPVLFLTFAFASAASAQDEDAAAQDEGAAAQENDAVPSADSDSGAGNQDETEVPGPGSVRQLFVREGSGVPNEVREIYDRGAMYLAESQNEEGGFTNGQNGIVGLALMAFLSTGEDPNFGRYAINIRRACRYLILRQAESTGYIGDSMYDHGFAMLALSEAYGAVDDELVWAGYDGGRKRTIGEALELCVRLAQTAQTKNSDGGWRYSPNDATADTSVSGAVLMGLLAARNAGIAVPDSVIDRALEYFKSMTSEGGTVAYAGLGGLGDSMARSSIACLVYCIGKRKDWEEFESVRGYLVDNIERQESGWEYYFRYYMAQALFQADYEAWEQWNSTVIDLIRDRQNEDGSVSGGSHGPVYSTSMSLLALALNYKFLPIYER